MSSAVPVPEPVPRFVPGFLLADYHPVLRYGVPAGIVAIGLVLDHLLSGVLLGNLSFFLLAAVMITALCAGYGPALVAVFLSISGLVYFFWIPAHGGTSAVGIGISYGVIAWMIAYVTGTVRTLTSMVIRNSAELEQALEQRNDLLSIMSQDFRIHLTSLKLNQGLLRLASNLDEAQVRRFDSVDREIARIASLIENVLEVSKAKTARQSANRTEFDLSELVQEIVDSFSTQAEQARCRLNVDLHPTVGRWERFPLQRVLTNLVANAIECAPGSDILLRTYAADGRATLVVEDHAPGIPEQQLKRLFEPTGKDMAEKDGELGLGLYVAKTIVDAQGGKIAVNSRIGMGSILTVELPL